MESGKLGCAVKREKGDDSNIVDGREDHKAGIVPKDHDHKLELAKAEIEEVREENQRLKKYLTQIMEDYKSLEKKLHDIGVEQHQERDQLVSLSLGRTTSSTTTTTDHRKKVNNQLIKHPKNSRYRSSSDHDDQEVVDELGTGHKEEEGLTLGLDCKFEVSSTATTTRGAESPTNVSSADNSVEEVIKEDVAAAGETWPPRKALKNARSINGGGDHNENPAKKARVSVRVRCETPTMNDGCQWRKYGQKIAKGNPCPRAYYRCTVSPSCPVRKQVQRCAQDMSILITTYEGTHNHPLPISATAMASTTSAAACMLMSGSTVSGSNPNSSASSTTPITTPAELHGLNFYFSDGSKPNQYYPPNSSIISPSPSCPTITLDLTSNTVSNSSSTSPLIINRSMPTSNFLPRYTSTNLNFSSWNNGGLNHGQNFVKNQFDQSLNFGRRPQENLYQAYMQKNMASNSTTPAQQSLLPDTIEAATKAITSDPNFQSALQAALSSIISSGAGGGTSGNADHGQNSKLGDVFPVLSSFPSGNSNNANKYVSSYLNKSTGTTTNSQPGSLKFLPPNSSPLSSISKSKSASPDNSRDQVK